MLEKISWFLMLVSFAGAFLMMFAAAVLNNGNLTIISMLVSIGVLPLVIIFSYNF